MSRRVVWLLASTLLISTLPAKSDQVFMPGFSVPSQNAALDAATQRVLSNPNPSNYKDRAEVYRKNRRHKDAVQDLNQALTISPNDANAQLQRGQNYFEEGMYPEAISDFSGAVKSDPKYADAIAMRGRSYNRLKNWSKAIDDANTLMQMRPDSAEAYLIRGTAYDGSGNYTNAVADLTKAIQLNAKEAKAYYYRADAYQEQGDYQKSVDDYTQAVTLQPNYRAAYLGRAWSDYKLKKDEDAVKDASKAIKFDNASALEALNTYAGEKATDTVRPDAEYRQGLEIQDDLKNALTLYGSVIKDEPEDLEAYRDRGIAYMHLAKYREASHDFDTANKNVPTNPSEFSGIGSEADYNAARPEYLEGNKQLAAGNYAGAAIHYQNALQKYPQYARCWHNLAIAYSSLKDFYSAELCCIHAISYRPDDWKLWNTLGFNLYHEYVHDKSDPNKLSAASAALSHSLSLTIENDADKEGVRQLLASVKNYERSLAPTNYFVVTTMPIN